MPYLFVVVGAIELLLRKTYWFLVDVCPDCGGGLEYYSYKKVFCPRCNKKV